MCWLSSQLQNHVRSWQEVWLAWAGAAPHSACSQLALHCPSISPVSIAAMRVLRLAKLRLKTTPTEPKYVAPAADLRWFTTV